MRRILLFSFLICFNLFSTLHAQLPIRGIAILDLTEEEEENDSVNAELFSAEHMVKVAGVPYTVTKDLVEAVDYSLILLSSKLTENRLSFVNANIIVSYVNNGGVLIVPAVEDESIFPLFGISSSISDKGRFAIDWDQNIDTKEMEWIDEPEEWTISLGRPTDIETIKTYGYQTTTATTYASYEDSKAAVTKNNFGLGQAFTIGVSWKDVILRNQINRDFQAQRITANGFEPTSDVFSLFIRGVFQAYNQHAVYLHTSPVNSKSTLIITHDVDSQTGMDSLSMFVDFEKDNEIEATYNITTRYFNDALMGAFYTDSEISMNYIKQNGQSFGSHSVGHFFDFADENIFPLGTIGNTMENYQPYNDGNITVGGSVYGECELSKNILETDLDIPITFFRTGHLVYPKYLIDVLEDLGYLYNSSSTASDVLTSFPYQNVLGRSFNGKVSTVYDIPVSISDVFHEEDTTLEEYDDLVDQWLEVTSKNMNNGAPTILLIHPNRGFKVNVMADYFNAVPTGVTTMEITKYGDFWKARESYQYKSILDEDESVLTIHLLSDINEDISFVCDNGQLLNEIIVIDKDGNPLTFETENWSDKDLIIYYNEKVTLVDNIYNSKDVSINVFPNPTSNEIRIRYNSPIENHISVDLFEMNGNHVMHLMDLNKGDTALEFSVNIEDKNILPGNFLICFKSSSSKIIARKLVVY